MMLYAYELVAIDGVKCEDERAPAHRLDQLFSTFPYVSKHIASLRNAASLSRSTSPSAWGTQHADDDFLCRDGLEQMREAPQKNGDKPLHEERRPGYVGKTVDVPTNPDYQPKFREPGCLGAEAGRDARSDAEGVVAARRAIQDGEVRWCGGEQNEDDR